MKSNQKFKPLTESLVLNVEVAVRGASEISHDAQQKVLIHPSNYRQASCITIL